MEPHLYGKQGVACLCHHLASFALIGYAATVNPVGIF
jgi:hypothetical protein